MRKIYALLIICVLCAAFLFSIAVSCERQQPPWVTSDVVMINVDGSLYTISIKDYKMKTWRHYNIVVKINEHVPKGEVKATFRLFNKQPSPTDTLILTFHSPEDARTMLRSGADVDVDVSAGRAAVVSVNKNEDNSGCFIGTLMR